MSAPQTNGSATVHVNGTKTNGVPSPRLSVIVVGAGLGGLACGAALREIADVSILESVKDMKEIGAAVHLAPNAHRLIQQWGGDLHAIKGVVCTGYREWTSAGEIVIDSQFNVKEDYGVDWMLMHRVDLHNLLRELATREDGPGVSCKLETGKKVVSVDAEQGIVTLSDGEKRTADVIVGADGIKSVARTAVVGESFKAEPSRHSAYRMLVPAEKILSDPELRDLGVLDSRISIVAAPSRRIITYPCRDKTLLNFVCCLPDEELHEISEEKWTAKGDVLRLVESFKSFAPAWQKLLGLGTDIGLWQLRDQEPLTDWVKGRTILVGDAAHPVLPHQGQGASQAMEDAEALAVCLAGISRGDVHPALRRVFNIRYKRASEVQRVSRVAGLGEMRRKGLGLKDGEDHSKLDMMQFRNFTWNYYGALRWEQEHPEWVISSKL